MSSLNILRVAQVIRLAGTPDAPIVIDGRTDEDIAKDPWALPGAVGRDFRSPASCAQRIAAAVLGVLQPGAP